MIKQFRVTGETEFAGVARRLDAVVGVASRAGTTGVMNLQGVNAGGRRGVTGAAGRLRAVMLLVTPGAVGAHATLDGGDMTGFTRNAGVSGVIEFHRALTGWRPCAQPHQHGFDPLAADFRGSVAGAAGGGGRRPVVAGLALPIGGYDQRTVSLGALVTDGAFEIGMAVMDERGHGGGGRRGRGIPVTGTAIGTDGLPGMRYMAVRAVFENFGIDPVEDRLGPGFRMTSGGGAGGQPPVASRPWIGFIGIVTDVAGGAVAVDDSGSRSDRCRGNSRARGRITRARSFTTPCQPCRATRHDPEKRSEMAGAGHIISDYLNIRSRETEGAAVTP